MIALHLVDAFADEAFTGNPAAVVLLPEARSAEWMQRWAMEMNQAETAFLVRQGEEFALRWFTPVAEVDLCGHATIASAHFLWDEGHLDRRVAARFHTRSGLLAATRDHDGWIALDLPAITSAPTVPPPDLAEILGATPSETLAGDFDLLCRFDDAAVVRALAPDLARLAQIDARGVLVTALGDRPGVDFVSRCFFPAIGIPEDPVTGSAHCALAMYWRDALGKNELAGWQASRRGGMVRCAVRGDRVVLSGRAVTTLRATMAA